MKNYPEITIPLHIIPAHLVESDAGDRDNLKMSVEDLHNYFDWFISIKDERLKVFYQQVFKSDQIELSESKLQAIYYFFRDHLSVVERTQKEIDIEKSQLPEQIRETHTILEYKFIEPTYSILFDTSIYLGEILIKEVSGLSWAVEEDKDAADYGYSVIVKENASNRMCPARIMEVLARQVYSGKVGEDRLVDLYHIWKNGFEGKQKDYRSMLERLMKKKKK